MNGYDRRKHYRFEGTKAILLKDYQEGDVKINISANKTSPYSNVKIFIDTMQT